jgi:multicomponent Na+:H+ antiporter subunit E
VRWILWPWHALVLAAAFSRDLVVSSLQVAKAVLSPRDISQPRFVSVPLKEARSGLEITMVANYITLTPGTLTVDVSPDRSTLLVHSLLAGETGDDVRTDIRDGIEARVVRVTRP